LKIAINEEKNPAAMFNLGVIFQDAGDTTSAKEHYLEVLKIDPHYTEARVNMAIILEKEGLN